MPTIEPCRAPDRAIANLSELLATSLQKQVVAALNIEPPAPSFYALFLKRVVPSEAKAARSQLKSWVGDNVAQGALFVRNYLATAPAPHVQSPSTPESRWRWPEMVPRDHRKILVAALVSSHLRTLMDEWLDTGRNDEEGESPGRRNIQMALKANCAVENFVKKYPPQFLGGDYSRFAYGRDGHLEAGNVFEAQNIEATRLFVNFIISDWNKRLCKCRYSRCGKYFLREKPRPLYTNGTFCCREHQRHGSAHALTTARRSKAKFKLIQWAAQWLAEPGRRLGKRWQSDQTLKDRLVVHLNKRMIRLANLFTERKQVRTHWVTRNRDEIERELTIQLRIQRHRKAAERGNADAQFTLGCAYADGMGVTQDYVEAVNWWRKAAERGNADAQFTLGCAYADGMGVKRDYVLAHTWENVSASASNSNGKDQEKRAKARDDLATRLTPQQLAEAQRLAKEWEPTGSQR